MEKHRYSAPVRALIYSFMSFCWAGKGGSSIGEMTMCAVAGLARGALTVALEGRANIWLNRFFAISLATAVMAAGGYIFAYPAGLSSAVSHMIPSFAAGSMMLEGMYTAHTDSGKKKMSDALKISVALRLGVFVILKIGEAANVRI